ncbi:MAG: hypothetical protein ABUL55_01630 [Pseudomonadota bacterium]
MANPKEHALIIALIIAQAIAMLVGLGLIWRRIEDLRAEVRQVRLALQQKASAGRRVSARRGEPAFAEISDHVEEAGRSVRFDTMFSEWRRRMDGDTEIVRTRSSARVLRQVDEDVEANDWFPSSTPSLSPEIARALIVVCALAAPLIGFVVDAPLVMITSWALGIASVVSLVSLRAAWRHTAWFATVAAGAWATAGYLAGVDVAVAPFYCGGLVLAAASGLLQARLRQPASPGLGLALFMSIAALATGLTLGLVGPAGIAFSLIVALAALTGATTLRLEPLNIVALLGAGIGLYVLSGQPGADIWFTPAATLAGAWFLGLAFVGVPLRGPRGLALAATGTIAPVFAVTSLYQAGHALETPFAGAVGFAALAVLFLGLLTLAARRQASIGDLKLTLWALGVPLAGASVAACALALPPPFLAVALAAIALAFILADVRWPNMFWPVAAASLSLGALVSAANIAITFGAARSTWNPLVIALGAFAAPALLFATAAHFVHVRRPRAGAWFEAIAIGGATATLAALTRIAFSGDMPALQPVSFVETGADAAIWLLLGLGLSARASHGAGLIRKGAAALLTSAGLIVVAASLIVWLSPWWGLDMVSRPDLHPPLGFAAPATALWAHWLYWRHADQQPRARFFFASAGVATAAWITLELVWRRASGDSWLLPALGAGAFVGAVALNFVPGLPVKAAKKQRRTERKPRTLRTLRLVQNERPAVDIKAEEKAER